MFDILFVCFNLADEWWTVARDLLQQELGEGVPIFWERFKKAFLDRFFPQAIREAES